VSWHLLKQEGESKDGGQESHDGFRGRAGVGGLLSDSWARGCTADGTGRVAGRSTGSSRTGCWGRAVRRASCVRRNDGAGGWQTGGGSGALVARQGDVDRLLYGRRGLLANGAGGGGWGHSNDGDA